MKKKLLFGLLILALIAVPLFATACEEEEQPPPAQQEEEEEEEEVGGDWWDELGEPQYGGSICIRSSSLTTNFDVTQLASEQMLFYWWESLFINDWKVDPDVWPFTSAWVPDQYIAGCLAKSWEMTDPLTLTVHIREGIYYEDKPPANGREFTAEDVQYHYDRVLGTGSGFTEPNPSFATQYAFVKKVTATEKYTVVFEFTQPSALNFNNIATLPGRKIECRECVELGEGLISDWTTVVGTGPWTLTDVVAGYHFTYSKNPDYWGYDERHPDNQLPYADSIEVLCITDQATAIAGLRTGQIDVMSFDDWKQAQNLAGTNPELQQAKIPTGGKALQFRYDLAPFNDIRVRKALQMAMNLEEIAETYYGGTVDATPCGSISQSQVGYCYPYADWPQELKDEYSYNPERARELLAEAAADGVFTPNSLGGFDSNCVVPSNADLDLLQIFQSYLLDIGINMEIREMDYTTFLSTVREGKHNGFSMTTFSMSGEVVAPNTTIVTFEPGSPRNYSRIDEPGFNQLREEFRAAADMSQIPEIMRQVDKLTVELHVMVQTFSGSYYTIYQPYLMGYTGQATLEGAATWYEGWFWARLWVDQALKQSMGR
jgi:peptide/nickel transport system substrate-binding protein